MGKWCKSAKRAHAARMKMYWQGRSKKGIATWVAPDGVSTITLNGETGETKTINVLSLGKYTLRIKEGLNIGVEGNVVSVG